MALPNRLSAALCAFTEQRSANLFAAQESLALLVDLTAELRCQLEAVGGPHAIEQLAPQTTLPTVNLYETVDETLRHVCRSYEAFAAAREGGKFKKELKHFQKLLPLGSIASACLPASQPGAHFRCSR